MAKQKNYIEEVIRAELRFKVGAKENRCGLVITYNL